METSALSPRGSFLRGYLSKLLPYAVLSASLFAVGILAGMIAIVWLPEAAAGVERSIAEFVQFGHGLGPAGLFAFIVINNVVKAAVMMFSGIVFGLIPIFFLVSNGMVLSVAAALISNEAGVLVAVAGLLPHGIIEISAVLLAAAAGLRLGAVAVERLQRRAVELKMELAKAWRFFVTLVLPTLILAGVVEALATPFLLMMVRG
jgi:stage II sporulation protein M